MDIVLGAGQFNYFLLRSGKRSVDRAGAHRSVAKGLKAKKSPQEFQ